VLYPVSQNFLLDLSPVTFSMSSVTSEVVEARTGKTVTANKLLFCRRQNMRKMFFSGHILII